MSSTAARRVRSSRRRIAMEEISMEMTPMIDIVFLLLIFFMVAATFHQAETDPAVKLPTEQRADPAQRVPGTTIVNIRSDGTITINKRIYSVADLPAIFMKIASTTRNPVVVIRGDRDSRHRVFLRVL